MQSMFVDSGVDFHCEERAVLQRVEAWIFNGFLFSFIFATFNRELLVFGPACSRRPRAPYFLHWVYPVREGEAVAAIAGGWRQSLSVVVLRLRDGLQRDVDFQ